MCSKSIKRRGAREMTLRLRSMLLFQRTGVHFLVTIDGLQQTSVTEILGDPMPFPDYHRHTWYTDIPADKTLRHIKEFLINYIKVTCCLCIK